jgi:hypothetical protein
MILYKCNACGKVDDGSSMIQLNLEVRSIDRGTYILAPNTYHVCEKTCIVQGTELASKELNVSLNPT